MQSPARCTTPTASAPTPATATRDFTLGRGDILRYLSVRISIDTTIPSGLYGDIVVTRLAVFSATQYASFGLRPAHFP